jgi:serine/threonine protein kinase
MALNSGDRLGPYEIASLLGAGGMGEVYRARDPRLGREVAVKILNEEASANSLHVRTLAVRANYRIRRGSNNESYSFELVATTAP